MCHLHGGARRAMVTFILQVRTLRHELGEPPSSGLNAFLQAGEKCPWSHRVPP